METNILRRCSKEESRHVEIDTMEVVEQKYYDTCSFIRIAARTISISQRLGGQLTTLNECGDS